MLIFLPFFPSGSTLLYVNELLYLWIGPHARWPRQIDYQTILEPELKLNPNDSAALSCTLRLGTYNFVCEEGVVFFRG